jgi:hypothetical protein
MVDSIAMKRNLNRLLLGLGLGLASQISGCGTSSAAVCDLVCDCTGCSNREYDDCVDDLDDLERDAEDDGCTAEYDDLMDCLGDELDCDDDRVDIGRCDGELEDLAECLDEPPTFTSVANPCDLAVQICGAAPQEIDCTGSTACASTCIVAANSCDVSDPSLASCIQACAGSDPGPAPPGDGSSGTGSSPEGP